MTPPGDGLDFHVGRAYQRHSAARPMLDEDIRAAFRDRPHGGIVVAGLVRERVLVLGGCRYLLFYTRKGQDVGLIDVFYDEDEAQIEAKRDELKRIFGKGDER